MIIKHPKNVQSKRKLLNQKTIKINNLWFVCVCQHNKRRCKGGQRETLY